MEWVQCIFKIDLPPFSCVSLVDRARARALLDIAILRYIVISDIIYDIVDIMIIMIHLMNFIIHEFHDRVPRESRVDHH